MPLFDHVTIVGVGLLGASLGLGLKKHKLARRVTGVGRPGSASIDIARQRGAIDEALPLPEAARADLVVLCTPVGKFPELMAELAPHLKPGTLVTDVGSTKVQVLAWARELMPQATFIGSHPMAGSEKTGPAAARADLYADALCLLCSAEARRRKGELEPAAQRVEQLWQGVGMKTLWLSAPEHDKRVAAISHLPHVAAFTLAATIARWPESFSAAAGGFCDTTRVAGSDAEMWKDIFLTNRGAILEAIAEFQSELAMLKSAIQTGNPTSILRRLELARKTRQAVLEARENGPS